jgi:MOSC domain-containing protein YiiM
MIKKQVRSVVMLIESINASKPVNIHFNNQEVTTGIFKSPIKEPVRVTPFGLVGDTIVDKQVHGGLDQAVYLYHAEDYAWWSKELSRTIDYGMFSENLTVSGLEDIAWLIGDRLMINDVMLEITAPRVPCFKLAVRMGDNTFVKKFTNAIRPGAYARVINTGVVEVGDSIVIEKTPMDYATVKEVFSVWHSKNKSQEVLKKALASPLAWVYRQQIQSWYDGR